MDGPTELRRLIMPSSDDSTSALRMRNVVRPKTRPPMEISGMPPSETQGRVFGNVISPGWFSTFGAPVVAGRDFTDRDRKGATRVAVVNEALVRMLLSGTSPLGSTITLYPNSPLAMPPMEIVGVAADAVYFSLREPVPPTWYVPLSQFDQPGFPLASASLSMRARSGSPMMITRSITTGIAAVNPQLALTFRPLADEVHASLTQERLLALLAGFFGGLAQLLAGLGLYGVTAYAVSRRRTEIGIRMALGAAPAAVVKLVLSRVALLVGSESLGGAGVSIWASQFIATLLYGLEPHDPVTLAGAAAMLAAVGAFPGWLPAWRASRIDPAEVLRG
jgi:putative ABC transport system permease protein